MHSGFDPEYLLKVVSQRQNEIRAQVQQETGFRRDSRALRGARLKTFKLWRLHIMVWFEGARSEP